MTDLRAIFRKPNALAVAALRLRLRNQVPTATWDALWQAEHDRAWMVAGALKADLLSDLGAAIDKARSQGTGLQAFTKDFYAAVERNSWHGWTGEGSKRGEAWRIRTIYRTNMATSRAAGNWAKIMASDDPFVVYFHGASLEPREQHLAWDGLILPKEHPFWMTHAPPNGWGCSCYVMSARSIEEAKRLGGKPDLKLPDNWQAINPRTGAPFGIDKGWAYAPGASVAATINAMAAKSVSWPHEVAKAFMSEMPDDLRDRFAVSFRALPSTDDALRRYGNRVVAQGPTLPPEGQPRVQEYTTMGLLTRADEARFAGLLGREVAGYDFAVSRSAVLHVLKKHGNDATERRQGQRGVTTADFPLLLQVLLAPDDVREDKGELIFTRRIGGELVTAVFARQAKRRMLSLVTMWIRV